MKNNNTTKTDTTDTTGSNLLKACENGNVESVKKLLEEGVNMKFNKYY